MKTTFPRRVITMAGALTLTSLFIAGPAAAQQSRVPADPRAVADLKPEFDRAASLNLPEAPLLAKAREGYLKNASTRAIRDAVRSLTDRLVIAADALKPIRSEAELVVGAEAIKLGATPAVLRNLRAAQREQSIEVGLGVLTRLVADGVRLEEAAAKVVVLLQRGATDRQILVMASLVSNDVASGLLAPSRALDVRSSGVLSLLPAATQGTAATQTNRPPPR
jgi:hypothetical protein